MRIILNNPRGFCAGVHMAIDVVDQLLALCPDQTIYVYHEIVHNSHVVSRFTGQGVVFVEEIAEIPQGSIVVFSAHGISPTVRAEAKERELTAIDATCPLVTKVHNEAIRYARAGYEILLIGHTNHQEVVGTRGEAPEAIQVVESPEDVAGLRVADERMLVYLTQTTLSIDDAEKIIGALKERFPLIKGPPKSDICYATTNRQHAVREVAGRSDLTLVIGSRNSSNSLRLTELAVACGVKAHLIDDVRELRDEWFDGVGTVLVTAGASAPEHLVAELCRELVLKYDGEIELSDISIEDVEFEIPATLKRLMRSKGIDPGSRRIHIQHPEITEEQYGTVPLTISAT